MYSTQVFYFTQRKKVVLLTNNGRLAYMIEYAKDLTLNKGVDNQIQFSFINQDQKPVDISGKEITCRIINADGTQTLLQKSLTPLLPVTGLTSLFVTKNEIENIDVQSCYYSLEIPIGSFNFPVFVDDKCGARGVVNIVNSILPSFVPARDITIPSHPMPQVNLPQVYYSTFIFTKDSPVNTVQTYFEKFTGTVQWQASTQQDFIFPYNLTPEVQYNNFTGTIGESFVGYHPYMRLMIVNDGTQPATQGGKLFGDVVKILHR